jgi:hypothetical protein
MRLVLLESPYAGSILENIRFANACMLDCFNRGEAPFASHLLYPQVLNDLDPDDRKRGILAGFAWGFWADAQIFYLDRGMSPGMVEALQWGAREHMVQEFRYLHPKPKEA